MSVAERLLKRFEAAEPRDHTTVRDAVRRLRDDIGYAMRRRGMTFHEIADLLRQHGLKCSLATLESYLAFAARLPAPDGDDPVRVTELRAVLRQQQSAGRRPAMPADLRAEVVRLYDGGLTLDGVADTLTLAGWPITKSGVRKIYLQAKPGAQLRPRGFERGTA